MIQFNRKYYIISLLIVLSVSSLMAATPTNWMDSTNIRIDALRKGNFTFLVKDKNGVAMSDSIFVELQRHEFPFGITIDSEATPGANEWDRNAKYSFFNAAVAPNEFKWSGVEANAGVLTYAKFDSILAYTNRIGWPLKGHTLLWGGHVGNYHEVPQWVQNLPRSAMNDSCKARILRDVKRYKGQISEYDVYNEPSHTPFLSDNIGDSIVWNSFKWAHSADPSAQLYLNDYNTIEWAEYDKYLSVLYNALSHGAPINGIGIQAHFPGRTNLNDVKFRLDKLAAAGLPMRITEFDMDVTKDKVTQAEQAINYANILRLCFSYPSITGFYFWGFQDPNVWRAGSGLFNSNKTPKPAADSVFNIIHKEWVTKEIAKTATDGTFSFRGFYGIYKVNARINGVWKQFTVKCNKADVGTTLELNESNSWLPKPELMKAQLIANDSLELIFDQNMSDPSNEATKFSVFGKLKNPVLSASLKAGNASHVVLKLTSSYSSSDYVTVAYMASGLKSVNGSKVDLIGARPVKNSLIGIIAAQVENGGKEVKITFSQNMKNPDGQLVNFSIVANGVSKKIESVSLKTDSSNVLLLKLQTAITAGDDVIFSYSAGTWQSKEEISLKNTGNLSVVNNLTTKVAVNESLGMKIYPNPVLETLRVSGVEKIQQIRITSLSGKELYRVILAQGTSLFTFNASVLNSGCYIISCKEYSGFEHRNIFIKQ